MIAPIEQYKNATGYADAVGERSENPVSSRFVNDHRRLGTQAKLPIETGGIDKSPKNPSSEYAKSSPQSLDRPNTIVEFSPSEVQKDEFVLDTFTGRIIEIECGIARVQLIAEDGTEYNGTRSIDTFDGLSIEAGSYFSCKTIQSNGRVRTVIGPQNTYHVSDREKANLRAELNRVYGDPNQGT